jgi:hypothetical protein
VNRGALVACLGVVAACSSVLGLDAPTLDPCAAGQCGDGAADAKPEAAPDAGPEAAPACLWDGAVPAATGTGVRCGGGCAPVVFCTGASPVCCQTTDDAGVSAFACAASETACSGYAIDCVNENDCAGSDVCCHDIAHTICAGSCTSGEGIACLPGSSDDCPTGKTCSVRVENDDAAAPYYTCQP